MTAEALPVNTGDHDKATPTQARMLRSAIQQLSLQGEQYYDEDTKQNTWGFSKPVDPADAQKLPLAVTQHFPEADGRISGYDVIAMWSPQPEVGRPEDRDSIAIERTTIHPSWQEVAAIKYELGEPSDTNPSGIKRDVTVTSAPLPEQEPGIKTTRQLSEGERFRITEEALKIMDMDTRHNLEPDEQAWADEFDDFSTPGLTEVSHLVSFVRGFAARPR